MTTTLRLRLLVGLVVALIAAGSGRAVQSAGAASAWETEWERTVKAAEQEGEFSYYTLGEVGFLGEFEKKFPRIKVRVVQGKGNELLVRIMTERRAGKYLADVARIGNTFAVFSVPSKSVTAAGRAFILAEVKDESKWWSGKHQYIDAEGSIFSSRR
jgi:ABC-type glycerol-3-phosphate transport system substrate-binding protein